jgi:hypothetical protein
MPTKLRRHLLVGTLVLSMFVLLSGQAEAQSHGHKTTVEVKAGITLTVSQQRSIRVYYASHPRWGAKALPPGMRKRLAKGKPLPPGIAKKLAPAALSSKVGLPAGYRLMEVGLDVVLVEAATGIVRDLLKDAIH